MGTSQASRTFADARAPTPAGSGGFRGGRAPLEVERAGDPAVRDRYVANHPRGTFCHLSAFGRAAGRCFGYEVLDLVARRDGEIAGVLPLGLVRSVLFGRRLVSVPFGVYGGPLADSPEAESALLREAERIARRRGVGSLVLRCREGGPRDWREERDRVTFAGPIPGTDEELLSRIPRETRRRIRVGLGRGFEPEVGWGALPDFYRLLCLSYRDHGSPVFPRRWFSILAREFGDRCVLFTLREGPGGAVAASVIAFLFRGEVAPYYVGARKDLYRRNVNHVLYYQLMRWARERGCTRFDFGRSRRGTGSWRFKKQWGLEEIPLDYRVRLVRDSARGEPTPGNPRYARRIAAWRRLPLWLANRLGPWLVRGLG